MSLFFWTTLRCLEKYHRMTKTGGQRLGGYIVKPFKRQKIQARIEKYRTLHPSLAVKGMVGGACWQCHHNTTTHK